MMRVLCTVTWDPSELSVKEFHSHVRRKKPNGATDDTLAWRAKGAPITIKWDKGPGAYAWPNATVPAGTTQDFGTPTALKGLYRYSLVVSPPGIPSITIDPEVEVSDGGPPNGRKKAAKKAAKKAKKTARKKKK
jgi:hypothetical protein